MSFSISTVKVAASPRQPLHHLLLWITALVLTWAISTGLALLTGVSAYAFLMVIPIAALLWSVYRNQLEKIQAARQHAGEMAALHLEVIEALATAIDAKDQTTHEHVRRVQIYAEGLARIFGLSEAEIQALHAGALLHDIGKLAVPDHILNKPGKLTPGEFEKMKIHTIVGAEILSRVNFPYPVVPIVRSHHERWDGKGYPDTLKGDEIPLTARILTVVDCFDAVREDRPYRRGLTREEGVQMLLESSGLQFDPMVVSLFIENLPVFEAQIAETLTAEAVAQAQRQKIDWQDPTIREQYLRGNTATPAAGYAIEPAAKSTTSYLEQIRSAQTEGTALYEIARSVSSAADLNGILEALSQKLGQLVPFDTCALFISQTNDLSAVVSAVNGRQAELFRDCTITSGVGVTGFVLAQRRVFANTDPTLDLLELKITPSQNYQNLIAAPLLRGEELVGVLTLYSFNAEAYSLDHFRLMETIAATMTDAVYNALRQTSNTEAAFNDPLTRLPNARSLEMIFSREVHLVERHDYPLTLLVLDVDGFKRFNDEHGHARGDRLLRDLAQRLLSEVRAGDTIARVAGDKFVLLLHRLTSDLVEDFKARIHQTLAAWRFENELCISLSIGHAIYNDDGVTLTQLIQAADARLHQAKNKTLSANAEQAANNIRFFPGVKRGAAGNAG